MENCLTSNPALNLLATRSQKDVNALIKVAETGDRESLELEGNYSTEEINEAVEVLKKIFKVRDVVLKVNLAYIKSAAQEDAYRTEPSFKLQGSYRNMNKIVEKVLPVLNDEELDNLLFSHYENESQTLTSGAEANLLKFKELIGKMNEEEKARWQAIKKTFVKKQKMMGIETGDRVGQVVAQLDAFGDGLGSIKEALEKGLEQQHRQALAQAEHKPEQPALELAPTTLAQIKELLNGFTPQPSEAPTKTAALDEAGSDFLHATPREAKFLLRVIRHQFNIMHHWLKPSFDIHKKQEKQMAELQDAVKASLGTHGLIIDHLEQLLGGQPAKPKKAKKTTAKAKPKAAEKAPAPRRRSTSTKKTKKSES